MKTETANQLPSPPPGMKWHREDGWKEGDLPQGYRPLAEGEEAMGGFYEARFTDTTDSWEEQITDWHVPILDNLILRTTRPLVFMHEGKEWTWHRPGDPMPCDGQAKVEVLYVDSDQGSSGAMTAHIFDWIMFFETSCRIIGWRYDETTKQVELGPEDVPPGTVLRGAGEAQNYDGGWCIITSCSRTGIRIWGQCDSNQTEITWQTIKDAKSEINRSMPLTGKWDAAAWEPCFKTVQIAH